MSDLIKRADAIDAVTDIQDGSGQRYYLAVSLVDKIRSLPSADAEVHEDYEHATLVDIKAPLRESAEAVQCDAISKRFISGAILQKISELNSQGEKAIPTAREFIRFKRFVDGIAPIRIEAVQGDWKIDEYGIYHCPYCHAINNTVYKSFCPNCGARMKGGDDE